MMDDIFNEWWKDKIQKPTTPNYALNDPMYRKGYEEGKEEGYAEGKEDGREELLEEINCL
jgi:flagellar biosynthesis/type III secretory pathway protein FliH